jgi:hypothetical protein
MDVSPGQKFGQTTLAVSVEAGVKATIVKGTLPGLVVEALAPGVEGATQLPGTMNRFAQPPVTSG